MSVQVDTTVSSIETPGHPGNVCMLQEVGCGRPVRRPTDEEDHLLSAAEVVDDGGRGKSKATSGGELHDSLG